MANYNFTYMPGKLHYKDAAGNELDIGSAESVADIVTEWLEDNITQETGYVLDTSLTVSGAAADAKAAGDAIQTNADDITDLKNQVSQNAIPIINSASGAIASFSDGADDVPVRDLVVNIEPVQSGSGDPSPDNVRPISGWTETNIFRSSENLLIGDGIVQYAQKYLPDLNHNSEGKFVSFAANATAILESGGFLNYIKFKENTQYTLIMTLYKTAGVGSNLRIVYTDETYTNLPNVSESQTKETIVLVTDANKSVTGLFKANQSGATRIYYDESGVFEGILTADDFVPYDGQTYSVDWTSEAGTVYGGTLDVTTGVLTVDRALVIVGADTGSLRNNGQSSISTHAFFEANVPKAYGSNNFISDKFFKAAGEFVGKMSGRATSGGVEFYLPLTVPDREADVRAWFADNPTQLCYELATPQTYQLTPTEVTTLLQQNNIFADTGDIESVEYVADTKTYIDNKFAELQALVLENA